MLNNQNYQAMQTNQEIQAMRKANRQFIRELREIVQATVKLPSPNYTDYFYKGSSVTASFKYCFAFKSKEFQATQKLINKMQMHLYELNKATTAHIKLYARVNYIYSGHVVSPRYIRLIITKYTKLCDIK